LLPLSIRLKPLAPPLIRPGELDHVVVSYRIIYRAALLANAAAIIVAHNHPSGDPHPSSADCTFTTGLVAAGRLLNVQVLDHLVVTSHSHFSFKEARLIGPAPLTDTEVRTWSGQTATHESSCDLRDLDRPVRPGSAHGAGGRQPAAAAGQPAA
jgi:hypothetical protein